jgi:LCP family protein required for cell wall assembly
VLRTTGIVGGCLVLVVAGVGIWFYQHLSGNLRTGALYAGTSGNAGVEKADAFGRTPIDILVIGTDSRQNAADCRIGGACSDSTGNGNADVEMLVHVSADRSNATVMSIPRDLKTQVPACSQQGQPSESGYYGMINSALYYGTGCQVAAVHQLTGIPIVHFVQVDFSGVVAMSNAVGGVPVCVSDNVYDDGSHLKLTRGTHVLKGLAALEFVRSRHSFGDGGDVNRTSTQHVFLSSLIRQAKSAGTLTNPVAVYSLADSAFKALTVDPGLGSPAKLVGLAADLSKVPTDRITFATMQTDQDPHDTAHLVLDPAARSLFAAIANDQSLSGGTAQPTASATSAASAAPSASSAPAAAPAAQVPAAQVTVRVENSPGGVPGRASAVAQALIGQGFNPATTSGTAAADRSRTVISYGAGEKAAAQTLAAAIGLPESRVEAGPYAGVRLLIGADWPTGSTRFSAASAKPAPADTHQALASAAARTAADTGGNCVKVSPYPLVAVNGRFMTPQHAFAATPQIPVSAP